MTAAQELLEHLRDAKPGARTERGRTISNVRQPDYTGRLFEPMVPSRVELPALGGCCEILYDWSE